MGDLRNTTCGGKRNRSIWLLAFVCVLSACGASPAPEFASAERVDVSRGGRSYTVFFTDTRVEVIRLGYASNGEHAAIRSTMISLVPEVTGCILVEPSLQGDSGEMRGNIRCPS